MKRAQIALEYLFVHGFALLILIGLLSTLVYIQSQSKQDVRIQQTEELAQRLQQEILLANSVHEGYVRVIRLPASIDSQPYEVELADTAVFVRIAGYEAIRSIPSVNGTLSVGENTIQNIQGTVHIQ